MRILFFLLMGGLLAGCGAQSPGNFASTMGNRRRKAANRLPIAEATT
jgi:hypothetical protein